RGGQPPRGPRRGGGARADHGLLRPLLPHPAPAARPLLARAGLHPRGRTGCAHRRGGRRTGGGAERCGPGPGAPPAPSADPPGARHPHPRQPHPRRRADHAGRPRAGPREGRGRGPDHVPHRAVLRVDPPRRRERPRRHHGRLGAGEPAAVLPLHLRAELLRDHPGRAHLRSGRRLPRGSRPGAPGGVQRRGDPGGARAQAPPADPGGALAARADRAPPGQGPAAEPDQPREQPLAHRRDLQPRPGHAARPGPGPCGQAAVPRLRGAAPVLRDLPRRAAHHRLHLPVRGDRPCAGARTAAHRRRGRGHRRRRPHLRRRARGGGAMRSCADCGVRVEGDWIRCPLCGGALQGPAVPNPYPTVPLRFSRRRVLRVLTLTSLGVIAASFLAQLLFRHDAESIGALRSVWLGVVTTWLVVLMAISKRRNLAKFIVYLVMAAGGVSVYWDFLTQWSGWSVTYVVPIVCSASIIGLLITVRLIRMELADYVVYSGVTVLLGLTPIVFLALGWVGVALPSVICGALSIAVVVLLLTLRGGAVRHELAKRLHL